MIKDIAKPGEFQKETIYLLYLFLIFLGVIFIKAAWISDDSYITFRTVDNFVNGFGLRWNIAERVQAYTHPLWMFLISFFYYFTGEIYYTVTILSLCLSLLSVYLVGRWLTVNIYSLFIIFSIFVVSKAFVDYSTSGLENPLSYLLLSIFFMIFFKSPLNSKNLIFLYVISSLAMFNRMDTILLYVFPLMYATYAARKKESLGIVKILKKVVIGFIPIICWMIFSLIYYGSFFPNTYYAKLNTGVNGKQLIYQGILYLVDSITRDTITIVVIGFIFLVTLKSGEWKKMAAAFGIFLYILYIVKIGGDFMSGRFLSLPLFAAAIILSRTEVKRSTALTLSILFLLIGCSVRHPTIFYNVKDSAPPKSRTGIVDERGYYFPTTGLITGSRNHRLPNHKKVREGKKLKEKGIKLYEAYMIGFSGFYAGPHTHIVDRMALADPLLSHLHIDKNREWRIGHFRRTIPNGYIKTLETGKNHIENPKIRELYNIIKVITRDNVFSLKRLKLIVKFNLGCYRHLTNLSDYR